MVLVKWLTNLVTVPNTNRFLFTETTLTLLSTQQTLTDTQVAVVEELTLLEGLLVIQT
jgi:hypothetical protein